MNRWINMWTIQFTAIFGDKIFHCPKCAMCFYIFIQRYFSLTFLYLCLMMALQEKTETCSMFWAIEVMVWKYSHDLQSMYLYTWSQCITTNICIEINPKECWHKFGSISIIFITNWKLQDQSLGQEVYDLYLYNKTVQVALIFLWKSNESKT
jgi:hypothetical protein